MGHPGFHLRRDCSAATDFDHLPAAVKARNPRIIPTASRGLMRRNRHRRMHVGLRSKLKRINEVPFELDAGCECIGDYPGQLKRN